MGAISEGEEHGGAVSLAGTRDYPYYLNQADHKVFGGGIFTFETPTPTTLHDTLVIRPSLILDLEGTITPASSGQGSDTEGWQ